MLVGKRWVSGVARLGEEAEIGDSVIPHHGPFFDELRDGGVFPSSGVSCNEAQKNNLQGNKQKK